MSTANIDNYPHAAETTADVIGYRAIYNGAIVGLALGVLSVFTLISASSTLQGCLLTTPIPALGIFVSLRSWTKIKRESDQYTGAGMAAAGLALSLFFLVAGVSHGGFVYATEVPDGYERITFDTLRPSEVEERGGVLIPAEAQALAGKKIFIKGYIRPGSAPVRVGIDRFLLVRDNNQCCFGDLSQVKYFDQMAVQITSRDRIEDTLSVLRMGGYLRFHPENIARGGGYPVYSLEADYAVQ